MIKDIGSKFDDYSISPKITVFFTSTVGADEVLVRLQLIKQIIKDANSMCISFSVSGIVNENMSRFISSLYTYPFNPQLVIKIQNESHYKNPNVQRNFYNWTVV